MIPRLLFGFTLPASVFLASVLIGSAQQAPAPAAPSFLPSRSAPPPRLLSPDSQPPYHTGVFLHPGGLHTLADLERMKAMVAAKRSPWIEDWGKLLEDPLSDAGYRDHATGNMGSSRQNASRDAHAAYLNFLRGCISGDEAHIDCAIRICNDWSRKVNQVPVGTDISGLSGIPIAEFAIVGELLRASPRWQGTDLERFKHMMTAYWYPVCHDFLVRHNGAHITNYWANWDIANIGALVSIGVLCDRNDIYDEGVAYYLRGPGMGSIMHAVYKVHADGLGQWQESGRDQEHAQLGVGMLAQACQIAWNQGIDLYGVADNRLLAGASYVARSNLGHPVPFTFYSNSQPANNYWLNPNGLGRLNDRPVWELLYNHYVVLRGLNAPDLAAITRLYRPENGSKDHFGYGTLTFTLDAAASPCPPFAAAPAAPTNLVATAGVSRVELGWTAPPDDTAQGYEIRRATSPGGPFDVIASWRDNTLPRHTDTEVTNGTRYYYEVAALNQVGASPASAQVDALPIAAGPLVGGWIFHGINSSTDTGGATFAPVAGNTVLLRAAGPGNIGGHSDACGFACRQVRGDFTFAARLASVNWSRGHNRVGLMVRANLQSDAKSAYVVLGDLGARLTFFGARSGRFPAAAETQGDGYVGAPVWFHLQRRGDTISGAESIDGKTWFEIGRTTVSLGDNAYLGLAAATQSSDAPIEATFDHITMAP